MRVSERPGWRAILAAMVASVVMVFFFVWLFAAALHQPQPHDLPVGFVGPAAVAEQVAAGVEANAPGAFVFTSYSSADEARTAVLERDVAGALIVGSGQPQILVASAGGQGRLGSDLGGIHGHSGSIRTDRYRRGRAAASGVRLSGAGALLPRAGSLRLGLLVPDLVQSADGPVESLECGCDDSRLRRRGRPAGGPGGRHRDRFRQWLLGACRGLRTSRPGCCCCHRRLLPPLRKGGSGGGGIDRHIAWKCILRQRCRFRLSSAAFQVAFACSSCRFGSGGRPLGPILRRGGRWLAACNAGPVGGRVAARVRRRGRVDQTRRTADSPGCIAAAPGHGSGREGKKDEPRRPAHPPRPAPRSERHQEPDPGVCSASVCVGRATSTRASVRSPRGPASTRLL